MAGHGLSPPTVNNISDRRLEFGPRRKHPARMPNLRGGIGQRMLHCGPSEKLNPDLNVPRLLHALSHGTCRVGAFFVEWVCGLLRIPGPKVTQKKGLRGFDRSFGIPGSGIHSFACATTSRAFASWPLAREVSASE